MNGTLSAKIGRAAADFVRHPAYASRYAKHNLFNDKTPLEHEIPWFSYAAIDFLDGFLRPDMTVCEYGTGGSTVFFARRVKSVFSIESDPAWFARVNAELAARKLANATVCLHPFNFKETAGFPESGYLHAIPDRKFDVIVVDGMEEWDQVRPACFAKAENHIKAGGIIIVDDSWRYPQLQQQNRAWKHQVFASVGPCRPGVTSTDVYFY
jgi:predicted O-methyltransferase YrrM